MIIVACTKSIEQRYPKLESSLCPQKHPHLRGGRAGSIFARFDVLFAVRKGEGCGEDYEFLYLSCIQLFQMLCVEGG